MNKDDFAPSSPPNGSAPSATPTSLSGDAALLETLDSFREAQLRLENRWLHQQLEEAKRALRVRNN